MNSAKDFISLQHQMRINNEELTSYLSDLDSWTSEMKKKDQVFQEMKPKHEVLL